MDGVNNGVCTGAGDRRSPLRSEWRILPYPLCFISLTVPHVVVVLTPIGERDL